MNKLIPLIALAAVACRDENGPSQPRFGHRPMFDVVSPDTTPTLLVAGDIADCKLSTDDRVGDLIRALLPNYASPIVTPLGDNAYPYGRPKDYACYDAAWGSFKNVTRPAPGNHEYDSSAVALGYTSYFGAAAGPNPGLYYSYNVGSWHIVVVNTFSPRVGTKPGSLQDNWLLADLAANTQPCLMGVFHHPRFYSATKDTVLAPLEGFTLTPWKRLYAAGADLILNGHVHRYERFVPLTPDGAVDLQNGITEIIVGTGGELQGTSWTAINPASAVRAPAGTFGVLKVSLQATGYSASFAATSGTFADSVSATCHRAPVTAPTEPPPPPPPPATDSTCTVVGLKNEQPDVQSLT